jgi:Plant transposon protein
MLANSGMLGGRNSCRKDIKRAFGVLQRKFQVLRKPMEWWFTNDIREVVELPIILLNMMVEEIVKHDKRENTSFQLFDTNKDINIR